MDFQTSATTSSAGSSSGQHESMLYSSMCETSNVNSNINTNTDRDASSELMSDSDALSLKQQLILNQFMSITGCCCEQSIEFLTSTNWQYQVGIYFVIPVNLCLRVWKK
jgi:hypothetical protein